MFIIQQGGARFEWDHTPLGTAAWISAVVGAVTTAAAVAVQWLLIRKRVAEDLKSEEVAAAAHAAAAAAAAAAEMEQAGQPQIEGGWGRGGGGMRGPRVASQRCCSVQAGGMGIRSQSSGAEGCAALWLPLSPNSVPGRKLCRALGTCQRLAQGSVSFYDRSQELLQCTFWPPVCQPSACMHVAASRARQAARTN